MASTPSDELPPLSVLDEAQKLEDARKAADLGEPLPEKPLAARMPPSMKLLELDRSTTTSSCKTVDPPQCPVCISFLCDPLTASCGHLFCRICLIKSTRLSPTGRLCPLCR